MKKFFTMLSNDVFIVVLLGIVSTATAWSGVQSSLHGGVADDAYTEYTLSVADANNMWITAEVKYRDDLTVWKDKRVRLIIDKVSDDDIYSDLQTSNGSYEFYVSAVACLIADRTSQLPDCRPYMDSVYNPISEIEAKGEAFLREWEESGKHSDRLQMLTALFAVALFMLGIASFIQRKSLISAMAIFSVVLSVFGIAVLFSIPALSA
jgi:hypothetical protein